MEIFYFYVLTVYIILNNLNTALYRTFSPIFFFLAMETIPFLEKSRIGYQSTISAKRIANANRFQTKGKEKKRIC